MTKDNIQKDRIQRPSGQEPSSETHATQIDEVIIQVTQAFCPKGHNLVYKQDEMFDGAMGITLLLSDGETTGEVTISPFHGDHSRRSKVTFENGMKLQIACPTCNTPLDDLSDCSCGEGGQLKKLYLTKSLSNDHLVAVCNVWGCHRSKVFDQAQLLAIYQQD